MKPVSVKFVLYDHYKDESEASDLMIQAYEACKQNKVNTCWIREKDIQTEDLKRKDVIVFESFEGRDFERFQNSDSAVLGPWCLLICLVEGKRIPNFKWPIFNIAMYDCIVATSHLSKPAKIAIADKVRLMGGYYIDTLTENTTHLITDSVMSEKYAKAAQMSIKIVTPAFVDAVWNASKDTNIHCNDKKFDQFKCLPFHKLSICSTGSKDMASRNKLQAFVCENGGHFTPQLKLKVTDFLICDGKRGAMSEKFREARKTGRIHCVTIEWVLDSIEKGYCLPPELYPVEKGTSTPEKGSHVNPDFSMISVINYSSSNQSTVNESVMPPSSKGNSSVKTKGNKRKAFTDTDLIEQLDLKKAKKSGQFLDGCSVYLVGFQSDHREKLCKIINASGATRCDDMSDRVSHVIVGDSECHEFKLIQSKNYTCSFVTIKWLLESIDLKRPCNEEPHLVNAEEMGSNFKSPLGQKGLNLLRSSKTITEVDVSLSQQEQNHRAQNIAMEAEEEILKQYLTSQSTEDDTLANYLRNANHESEQLKGPQPQNIDVNMGGQFQDPPSQNTDADPYSQTTFTSQSESQSLDIFKDLTFLMIGFDDEQLVELREQIRIGLGRVTRIISQANFIIAPSFITEPLDFEEGKLINDIWIYESIRDETLVPIKYYHRPVVLTIADILDGCVVTISGYTGYERNFLSSLVVQLGGTAQEQFCRVTSVEKNLLRSTHLITAEASGKKYVAANKWGLPAVRKNWLLESAKQGKKLSEDDFNVSVEANTNTTDEISKIESSKASSADEKTIENAKKSTAQSDSIMTVQSPHFEQNSNREPETGGSPTRHSITPNDTPATPINNSAGTSSRVADDVSYTLPPPKFHRPPVEDDTAKSPDYPKHEICTQVTPVDKIMREVRLTNLLGTPATPQLAKAPWDVDTPDTPYGRIFDSNPSKSLRKNMLRFLNQFPDKVTPPARRKSTPLSELARRFWAKIGTEEQSEDLNSSEVFKENEDVGDEVSRTQCTLVNSKLQQLEQMAAAAGTSSASKKKRLSRPLNFSDNGSEMNVRESQPQTVDWDFGGDTQQPSIPKPKIFLISGVNDVETREHMLTLIEELGGRVSTSSSYDPECTHLLCPKPPRNEKTLSCMAAGKWILHTNYLDACVKAGNFLDEEDYEFGNPNSLGKIPVELGRDLEIRMQAIHFWRKEIARTKRGPFHDMRAIVVAERKQSLLSVIEAGGGTVIDALPPYTDIIHATHCLIEPKSVSNFSLYEPLAKQGIYCVNTVYLSEFLHRSNKDIKESVLPFFQKYFK